MIVALDGSELRLQVSPMPPLIVKEPWSGLVLKGGVAVQVGVVDGWGVRVGVAVDVLVGGGVLVNVGVNIGVVLGMTVAVGVGVEVGDGVAVKNAAGVEEGTGELHACWLSVVCPASGRQPGY